MTDRVTIVVLDPNSTDPTWGLADDAISLTVDGTELAAFERGDITLEELRSHAPHGGTVIPHA